MSGMREVEEHLAAILAAVTPTGDERVTPADAQGRVLRAAVVARLDIPAFDNSAMDGFAVRAEDIASPPVTLRVIADLPAGSALDPSFGAGEAVRIMTGAPVPTAADAIVPFEDTVGGLADSFGEITVTAPARQGAFVRRRGVDVRVGDEVVPSGAVLGPLQLGAATAAGVTDLVVARRPRVAIVSTGDELVMAGQTPGPGRLPDSNGVQLAALALEAGAEVAFRAVVPDDDAAFLAAIAGAVSARADLIVTSGGISAGAFEIVKTALAAPDSGIEFVRVRMQPGKPQAFGRLAAGPLLFGLPGNPVSSALSFEVFVRPAIRAMAGARDLARPLLRLAAASGWRTPPGRRQYLPAVIDRSDPAAWTVAPATAGGSGSHLAGGLARAEAYAIVPADIDEVSAGDLLDVMLLG